MFKRNLFPVLCLGLAMDTTAIASNTFNNLEDESLFVGKAQALAPDQQALLNELSTLRTQDGLIHNFIQFLGDGGENNRRDLLINEDNAPHQVLGRYNVLFKKFPGASAVEELYGMSSSSYNAWYHDNIEQNANRIRALTLAKDLFPAVKRGFEILQNREQSLQNTLKMVNQWFTEHPDSTT